MERVFKVLDLPRRGDIEALNANLQRVAEAVESLQHAELDKGAANGRSGLKSDGKSGDEPGSKSGGEPGDPPSGKPGGKSAVKSSGKSADEPGSEPGDPPSDEIR
jgi:hypothetical protein